MLLYLRINSRTENDKFSLLNVKYTLHYDVYTSQILVMNSRFLLPHKYRLTGWIILIPFLILGILSVHLDYEIPWLGVRVSIPGSFGEGFFQDSDYENFTNEVAALGVLIGLLFIAFSREKIEDEYIAKLRLDSLLVAVLGNYLLLFLAIVLLYGFNFFYALVYNMYTVLILFIARFHWVKRGLKHEEV